jgi:excinuclease UvrABC nuclease subunit
MDFEAVAVSVTPGAARTRGGAVAADGGGPGLALLRLVRDEAHAVALGAHRRRRRSSLFGEITDARQRAAQEDEEEDAARVAAG